MNRRSSSPRDRADRARRSPNFDSGVLTEPLIAFGGQHFHVDPKTGLGFYGPYSLAGQKRPLLGDIVVGIVGPLAMVADAEQWLNACAGVLTNDGSQPFLRPHFPGFSRDSVFKCDLIFGNTWRETIKVGEIAAAVGEVNFHVRLKRVAALYVKAVEVLALREPKPNVILCCLPQDVIDHCTHRITKSGEVKRIKISRAERAATRAAGTRQMYLFAEMDPSLGIEEEVGYQNLRRGLKAETMQFGIPTQLIWPRTLQLVDSNSQSPGGRLQGVASRA